MRCIDADALRDRLQNLGYDDWNQGATTTWAEAFSECADMVDEQPTIEPQRKNGHWIKISPANIYECSECGKNVMTGDISAYDFCHGCGADMREDAEEPKKCDTCQHEKEPWSMHCHSCDGFKLWEAKQ